MTCEQCLRSSPGRSRQEVWRKGVVFVGINSNEQDEVEAIARHAKAYQIPFPVLKDENFKIAEKSP